MNNGNEDGEFILLESFDLGSERKNTKDESTTDNFENDMNILLTKINNDLENIKNKKINFIFKPLNLEQDDSLNNINQKKESNNININDNSTNNNINKSNINNNSNNFFNKSNGNIIVNNEDNNIINTDDNNDINNKKFKNQSIFNSINSINSADDISYLLFQKEK